MNICATDCSPELLFMLYFWPDNRSLPLSIKGNFHCFVFGIIFNISKSQWTKGFLLWLLVDNISRMICLLSSVSMPIFCLTSVLKANHRERKLLKGKHLHIKTFIAVFIYGSSDLVSPEKKKTWVMCASPTDSLTPSSVFEGMLRCQQKTKFCQHRQHDLLGRLAFSLAPVFSSVFTHCLLTPCTSHRLVQWPL